MACMLYARYNGKDERVGKFKTREAAERYWPFYLDRLKAIEGHYAVPVYVMNNKRKSKWTLT